MTNINGIMQWMIFIFVFRFALALEKSIVTTKPSPYVINWAGYKWYVYHTSGSGSASNNFNASNVWIDSANRLHLKVSHSTTTDKWSCAEVFSDVYLTYGTYKWKIHGRIDLFDPNIVFGIYSYGGPSGSNEIDIEVASWGEKVPKPYNIHYTTYPGTLNGTKHLSKSKRFDLTNSHTTHWFTWTPTKVTFGSQHGFHRLLFAKKFFAYETPPTFAKDVPSTPMRVHMNLWLWGHQPPMNGKEVEVIIKEFSYTRL